MSAPEITAIVLATLGLLLAHAQRRGTVKIRWWTLVGHTAYIPVTVVSTVLLSTGTVAFALAESWLFAALSAVAVAWCAHDDARLAARARRTKRVERLGSIGRAKQ